jgi:hypothetical protein
MEIVGTLRRNDLDKWEIVDADGHTCVLSSGSVCEVQIAGHWIRTWLEYCHGWQPSRALRSYPAGAEACGVQGEHASHYYAVDRGVVLCEGLPARVTARR